MVAEVRAEARALYLTPVQSEFVSSERRYPGFFAGRGSGKSIASMAKMLWYLNAHPGALGMFTLPTFDGVEKVLLPTMRTFWGESEGRDWGWLEKKSQLVFPGLRAKVMVRPASEPEGLRGPNLAFAAMDEVAVGDQSEAFRVLQAAIRVPGFPNQLWVTSTPTADRPWIKQTWQDGAEPLTGGPLDSPEEYPVFRMKTKDNPHLPEWFRKQAAGMEATRWGRQEYAGEFLTVSGIAFPELSEKTHLKHPPAGTEWKKAVTGMDFGQASPTALLTIKQDTTGHLWATDEFYQRNALPEQWGEWCGERAVYRLLCDPSLSENDRLDFSRRYGIQFVRSRNRSHAARYQFWASHLSKRGDGTPGIYISPSCKNLWDELTNLAFHSKRGMGDPSDEWAPGCQDHLFDAGAYAGQEFVAMMPIQPIQFVRYLN